MTDPISQMNRAFESGDYSGAKEILNRHLTTNPSDTSALYFLGVVEQAMNSWDAALSVFDRVLALDPLHARAHYNKALLLMGLDKHEDALKHHALAVQLDPQNFWARLNRGNSFAALGKFDKAINDYQSVISMAPNLPEAWGNKGNVLRELKQPEEALASYDHALKLNPEDALAWSNRGNALYDLRRPEEALASYEHALTLKPDYPEVLNSRGIALLNLKRPEGALLSYNRALALKPDYAEALNNRGVALMDLQQHDEALLSCDRAIELKRGDYAEALYNRGIALRELGRLEDAAKSLARLLEISPDFDYALGDMFYLQLLCCNWTQFAQDAERVVQAVTDGKKASYSFPFLAVSHSAATQLRCARTHTADTYPLSSSPLWAGERYRHDRIRLAYLSADFRAHPSSFLLAGMFEHHDRGRFETIAISFGNDDQSEIRTRVKGAFEDFIDVRSRSDLEVARLMREREVDIAVDLMGHTRFSRMGIFALRPAPVQVNFFCPGTSGADYLDYIICDRVVTPEDHQVHYTEEVVYLPDTFQANDSKRRIAEHTPSRAEAGLPERGFVFCSFNNTYKFTPAIFDIWMRLLGRVEGSVLWLQQVDATATENLRREANERGIDAGRLVFAPRVPQLEDHLARYRLADLFLDTLPYNAQTTASDALWAGLPVLTCLGTTFVGRVAASLLHAIGLPELVTHSLEEYEHLALELATHPERLAEIKSKLARNRDTYPLFDTDRFRRHIEAAYTTMWERYQKGEPPCGFTVKAIEG